MKKRNLGLGLVLSGLVFIAGCQSDLSGDTTTKEAVIIAESESVSESENQSQYESESESESESASIPAIPVLTELKDSTLDLEAKVFDRTYNKYATYGDVLEYIKSQPSDEVIDLHRYHLSIMQQLDILAISDNVEYAWFVDIDGVTVDSDATEIVISEHDIKSKEYTIDDIISLLPNIKRIEMCNCGYTNDEMAEICDSHPDIRIIWEIVLSHWRIRTDVVAFSTMKTCAQTFYMYNEDAKYLKYCTDLVALDLGHNFVTDISFLQYMPELRILILVDNTKGWENGRHVYLNDLSMLQYTPKLRYLEFFVGSVRDLSFLQYTPDIVDLNISYNPVSDASYLFNLPKLERLMMEHTNIPYSEYERLVAAYPDAQIEYYGEGSIDHGWREHPRYYAMRDMFKNNYVNQLFLD